MEDALRLEVVRQRADQRRHEGVAPVVVQIDRLDIDLQDLAGLGPGDRDRTGADMARQRRPAETAVDVEEPCGWPQSAGGSISGPPETVEMVMRSPEAMVVRGASVASK